MKKKNMPKLKDEIFYGHCSISQKDRGYEIVYGCLDDDGVDCISAVPCDTIDNAIMFINKRLNGDFEDDDDAYDYAMERWG